jgi:CRISPR type III-associated protein (TIGR04423 family)
MEEIKGKYEGYIWMSDATHPVVYHGDKIVNLMLDEHDNPFIIEGELFDRTSGESISVRFVDGRYIIARRHVGPDELKGNAHATPKCYLAQRMPGVAGLNYLQYWETVSDPLCEGMTTLQPSDLVFVGFKNQEE